MQRIGGIFIVTLNTVLDCVVPLSKQPEQGSITLQCGTDVQVGCTLMYSYLASDGCSYIIYDSNGNCIQECSFYKIDGASMRGGGFVIEADMSRIAFSNNAILSKTIRVTVSEIVGTAKDLASLYSVLDSYRIDAVTRQGIVNLYLDASSTGGSGGASPDWNAKEGEAGHVLNRTHYRELVELADGALVDIGDDILGMAFDAEFVAGEIYSITYNGVEYTCTAFLFDTGDTVFAVVGNRVTVGLEDTGEPFTMYVMDGMLICADLSGATEAKVKIVGYRYATLSWKYLPKPVHWIDAVEVDGVYEQITVTPAQTQEAIEAGLEVRLRIKEQSNDAAYTYILPCVTQMRAPAFPTVHQLIFSGKFGLFPAEKTIWLALDTSSGSQDIEEYINLPWVVSND